MYYKQDRSEANQSFETPIIQAPSTLTRNVLSQLDQVDTQTADLSVEQLQYVIRHAADWQTREKAVRALGTANISQSREMLVQALEDPDEAVRAAAAYTLGKSGMTAPIDSLLTALQDSSWTVREAASWALYNLGSQGMTFPAEPLMMTATCDQDNMVREAALSALQYADQTTRQVSKNRAIFSMLFRWHLLLFKQIALIHKGLWITPLLVLFCVCMQFLFNVMPGAQLQSTVSVLAIFTTTSAAVGVTFLTGARNDVCFELTCATPTSIRQIVLARFLLIMGYNVLLAIGMSILLAILKNANLWDIVQVWLGPLCLLSSLALALSALISSWWATAIVLLLEATQSIQLTKQMLTIEIVLARTWQTSLPMVLLTILCLVVAIVALPKQSKLVL